jgi:hypothetical protein
MHGNGKYGMISWLFYKARFAVQYLL